MGWLVWIALTALCLASSWMLAAALFRGSGDRAVAMWLFFPAQILVALQLAGIPGLLAPVPLGVVSLLLFSACALLAGRAAGRAALAQALRQDLAAPLRTLREAPREPALLCLAPALAAGVITLLIVWFYRSWTWDPCWYHVAITDYPIQQRSLAWPPTWDLPIQGYARNVEWLSTWSCIFPRDNRFDDSGQLPFCLLGVFAVAAWARRLGSSRPLALGLGAAWFALPPVFLQAYTTHVDVAAGALFTATAYFLAFDNTRRARWLALTALGLYVGTKFTGVLHAALLAPWFAARLWLELRASRRWTRLFDVAGSIGLACALGLFKYAQNFVHTGNPMFPFRFEALGHVFPGPQTVGELWGLAPGVPATFLRAPGDLRHLWTSWMDSAPFYAPDVRSGGFGPAFRWVLLPCVAAVALFCWRAPKKALPVLALFALSLAVPAAWWPRFVIAAASASLVAFAIVHRELRWRSLQVAASLALAATVCFGFVKGFAGYIAFPQHFLEAARAKPGAERAALQLDKFNWPTRWAMARETELRPGDVIAYDESAGFIADYFSHDYATRVVAVSSRGDPNRYLARLRALRAVWAGVERDSAAERALRAAGATFLFSAPLTRCNLYRLPRS